MRVLYITQYFPPEIGAPMNRALANTLALTRKGHSVKVLTAMPNHPQGIIFPAYKGKLFINETIDGIDVNRLWIYTTERKTFLKRIVNYISFSLSVIVYFIIKRPKLDMLYLTSPPLFVGLSGLILSFVYHKCKLVFEVRDLWPDSAIELGELQSRFLIRCSLYLEKKIYCRSDLIVAVTSYIKKQIISKGISQDKVLLNYNGTQFECVVNKAQSGDNSGMFTAVYAGNIGLAQGVDVIIKAANILRMEPIRFVIIGNGPCKHIITGMASELNLQNVQFIDEVPVNQVLDFLSNADCGIIPLKKLKLFTGALPSKIFDYMAASLAILVGVLGEAESVIKDSNSGLIFEPENENDLAEKLLYLMQNRDLCHQFGKNGSKYVRENFDRNRLSDELVNRLDILMSK